MARTGFGSRLLLGPRSTTLLGRLAITLGVLVVGSILCLGGAIAAARAMREVLDPASALYRLRHLSGAAQATGVFRLSSPVRAQYGDRPPLCEVVHEHYVSGKNGGWRRDGTWFRSAGATTGALRIEANEPFVLDPLDMLVVGADREAWLRTVLADVPAGGRLRAHCVEHTQTVFLEGCVDGPDARLTGCGVHPLTITTGDGTAQPRIDAHANLAAAGLSAGAGALVAVLAYLWWVLRARPLADALLHRAGTARTFASWPAVAALVGAAVVVAVAQCVMVGAAPLGTADARWRAGYLAGLLVCAVAGVLAVAVRHRRQNLERAMAPVREAETVRLRDARGGVVELAVTVRDAGDPAAGVLDAGPHAWVEVRVDEVTGYGKTQVTRRVARRQWPAVIPIADESGEVLLDPAHAELDLRSTVKIVNLGTAAAVALARSPVGALEPGPVHQHWIVEESVLRHGESLYLLGRCQRVENPRAAGSYRTDATMAVVGGTADDRIIVHAGDERSLLRSIGLERTYLDALTAALAGVAVSLAATMAALWAL